MRKSIIYRALAKAGVIQKISAWQRRRYCKSTCPSTINGFNFDESISNPNTFYRQCVSFFDNHLSNKIKEHRKYFSQNQRGFGEDAFHVMWTLLVDHYKPKYCLEIGVYRGQVLSLMSLLQKRFNIDGSNVGIGPFERIGDATSVKDYGHCPDWLEDIKHNIAHFDLPQPKLVKALSTDAEAIEEIYSREWDMIYIDGNHDYDVVVEDWNHCSEHIKLGGIIILDDSGMGTLFQPPLFASQGFPGPSKVANEVDRNKFREVLQVGHNRVFERVS